MPALAISTALSMAAAVPLTTGLAALVLRGAPEAPAETAATVSPQI